MTTYRENTRKLPVKHVLQCNKYEGSNIQSLCRLSGNCGLNSMVSFEARFCAFHQLSQVKKLKLLYLILFNGFVSQQAWESCIRLKFL